MTYQAIEEWDAMRDEFMERTGLTMDDISEIQLLAGQLDLSSRTFAEVIEKFGAAKMVRLTISLTEEEAKRYLRA